MTTGIKALICTLNIKGEGHNQMIVILLSGGTGKRLWPLSNDIRSKQFIKIFKNNENYESMVQRMYRQIKTADIDADVTIATSKTQVSAIRNQLGEKVEICVEPCRRDTFPAIILASAFLADIREISREETVVVCPVDPYVENDYFETIKELSVLAKTEKANLALMGIEPTYPSEKYGYIIPNGKYKIAAVSTFKEKPCITEAEEYIKQGALWNGGVFAYKLQYVLDKANEIVGYSDYDTLLANYSTLPKISFDYAVVEKERKIQVMRFSGMWEDIGTWNTLTQAMDKVSIGNARQDGACMNVNILNELDIPIIALGVQDMVIAASPGGVLVSDKKQSTKIKAFLEDENLDIRFAEKSWGDYKVIDVEDDSLTIKTTIKAGHSMNYHSHERRDEVWTVISGVGRTIVDGMEQPIKTGDVITMQAGCRHTVIADTELKLIEVQLGKEISVSDKQKYDLEDEK